MPTAVVLLSGGLDSATCVALAKAECDAIYALSIDYGQRHRIELDCAARVANALGVKEHRIVSLDLRAIGGSALTSDLDVPKGRSIGDEIPVTYVPARNSVFLAIALGFAEVVGSERIYVGVNAVDYSGYPDCRPEFIQAFQDMANLATKAGVEGRGITILTPLIDLTKPEIIRLGLSLGVDYDLTSSCYDPSLDGTACGQCDSCQIRERAFREVASE